MTSRRPSELIVGVWWWVVEPSGGEKERGVVHVVQDGPQFRRSVFPVATTMASVRGGCPDDLGED